MSVFAEWRRLVCVVGFLSRAGFFGGGGGWLFVLCLFIVSTNREVRNLMSCSSAPCRKSGYD